jgi:hypothetical protein
MRHQSILNVLPPIVKPTEKKFTDLLRDPAHLRLNDMIDSMVSQNVATKSVTQLSKKDRKKLFSAAKTPGTARQPKQHNGHSQHKPAELTRRVGKVAAIANAMDGDNISSLMSRTVPNAVILHCRKTADRRLVLR